MLVLVEDERVVGYFSFTMGSVRREEAPVKLVRGLPAYPVGTVSRAPVPAVRATQDVRASLEHRG